MDPTHSTDRWNGYAGQPPRRMLIPPPSRRRFFPPPAAVPTPLRCSQAAREGRRTSGQQALLTWAWFGPALPRFSGLSTSYGSTRAASHGFLTTAVYCMAIAACNPMLCPNWECRPGTTSTTRQQAASSSTRPRLPIVWSWCSPGSLRRSKHRWRSGESQCHVFNGCTPRKRRCVPDCPHRPLSLAAQSPSPPTLPHTLLAPTTCRRGVMNMAYSRVRILMSTLVFFWLLYYIEMCAFGFGSPGP